MRLFIAINMNDDMKDELLDLQDEMMGRGVYGNFTREENMHLTLAFIGEYGDPEAVSEVIDNIDFKPFRVSLDGLGAFHSLWWAGVKPKGPLFSLAKKVRRELANAGIPFDRKKFMPHITLVRKPVTYEEFTLDEVWESVIGSGNAAYMTVDHISLMRSDRGKHGMIYTELNNGLHSGR